ncbi:MAG: hypothetical protein U1E47_08035 [Rivihabitans pingtungensis]
MLALRLTLALLGRARGFPRLWPQSPRLSGRIGRWVTLGVLSGSLLTLGLGMSMVDNRAALSEELAMLMPAARADDGGGDDDHHAMRWGDWLGRALRDVEEAHEALSQGALALVAGHIGWVWLAAPSGGSACVGYRQTRRVPSAASPTLLALLHGLAVLSVTRSRRAAALSLESADTAQPGCDKKQIKKRRTLAGRGVRAYLPQQHLHFICRAPRRAAMSCKIRKQSALRPAPSAAWRRLSG